MKTPSIDTVYKSYIDAYHAAETLKRQNADEDTIVRIEKAPFSDGYVVNSAPVFLETYPLFGLGEPDAPVWGASPNSSYGDKR